MSKKVVATSKEAYLSLDPDKIRLMYRKISDALIARGPSTYEEIADYLQEKPERIWKRLSECNRIGLCYRTGERRIMSSKRQGFVWAYGHEPETEVKKKKVMKGKTVVQFSRAILNQQERLF
jgi:predicted transcriptional regulator